MEKFIAIITNLGFWTIVAPVFLAILAWYLNERAKRKWEEYGRKEERYKELLRTLKGFYVKRLIQNSKKNLYTKLISVGCTLLTK